MNKTDLIDHVQRTTDLDRADVVAAVESVLDTIVRSVNKGENVTIQGFGVFERARRAPRTARNIGTGEKIRLRAKNVPAFRPSAQFKAVVSGAKKLPRTSAASGRTTAAAAKAASASPARKASTKPTTARGATAEKPSRPKKSTTAAAKPAPRKAAPRKAAPQKATAKSTPQKSTSTSSAKKAASSRTSTKAASSRKRAAK